MNHPLKYLFVATYADGSTIEQTPEDKSAIDPEKRSQFFDVLEAQKEKRLVKFSLKGSGHEYVVSLRDGYFGVDGAAFKMHDSEIIDFELVFFRQHTHSIRVSAVEDQEIGHSVVYFMGWKSSSSPNYQRVMQIN